MRISDDMRAALTLHAQSRAEERLVTKTKIAASGLRVAAPSDDPVAYAAAARHAARLGVLASRQDTVDRRAGDLELAEGTLAEAGDLLVRAKELALQASNGSVDAATRAGTAKEVAALREQLAGLANTRGASGYIFGGTRTDTPPFDPTGTFFGNGGTVRVDVADGVSAVANANGAQAFTAAGGRDVFADLSALEAALATNNVAGIRGSLDTLEAGRSQVVRAGLDAGTAAGRLRSASSVMSSARTAIEAARARETEADAPTAYSDLEEARTAFERSLAVTKRILSISSFSGGQ